MREAVLDVLLDCQMRKQSEALKNVSDAPFGYRKIDALSGIEQNALADGDAALVRLGQTGNAIE